MKYQSTCHRILIEVMIVHFLDYQYMISTTCIQMDWPLPRMIHGMNEVIHTVNRRIEWDTWIIPFTVRFSLDGCQWFISTHRLIGFLLWKCLSMLREQCAYDSNYTLNGTFRGRYELVHNKHIHLFISYTLWQNCWKSSIFFSHTSPPLLRP